MMVIAVIYVILGGLLLAVLHIASVEHPMLAAVFLPTLLVLVTVPLWLALPRRLRLAPSIIAAFILVEAVFIAALDHPEFRLARMPAVIALALWIAWFAYRQPRLAAAKADRQRLALDLFLQPDRDVEILALWATATARSVAKHLGQAGLPLAMASLPALEQALQDPAYRDRLDNEDLDGMKSHYVGAFVGEILRLRLGGAWIYDPVQGAWALAVNRRLIANPFAKVQKFLAQGASESLRAFCQAAIALEKQSDAGAASSG